MARHTIPAGTNRSRTKHQTAITQKLMAIMAALPVTMSNSLLATKKPTITPESTGERSAPRFQIRNAEKRKLPMVIVIQTEAASHHGSIANGTVNEKAVGR